MRMSAQCDTSKGIAQLKAQFAAIRDIAEPRALNTLADQAEVAGFRKVAEVYDIPGRTLQRYTTRKDARSSDLEASITVKGRGFPLSEFRPKQTARGVQVTIKGRTFVIPHTFMIRKFGKHVFARGSYGGKSGYGGGRKRQEFAKQLNERTRQLFNRSQGPTGETFGRFVFSKGRLPINQLWSLAPPDTWSNPSVTATMQDRVDRQAAAVLRREIAAVTRGY